MGDISSIALPDGSSYDLKDAIARDGIPYSIDTISVVSGAAELHDHAVNVVAVEGSSCVFTLPATVHGKSRDFVIHAILSGDAYLTFSSYDAGGGAVSWLNGDQSGTYEQGHVLIGVTESGSAQGSFIGSNFFALDEIEKDISKKYEKPAGGIPASDIAAGVIPEVPEPSDDNPLAAQGVPSPGTNGSYSRSDHVHPTDTTRESVSNKVTSLSSSSTDTQYPSAKCVYDIVGDINSVLDSINGEVI